MLANASLKAIYKLAEVVWNIFARLEKKMQLR